MHVRTLHAGILECLDFLESQNGAAVRPRPAPTIDGTSKVAQPNNVFTGDIRNSATMGDVRREIAQEALREGSGRVLAAGTAAQPTTGSQRTPQA